MANLADDIAIGISINPAKAKAGALIVQSTLANLRASASSTGVAFKSLGLAMGLLSVPLLVRSLGTVISSFDEMKGQVKAYGQLTIDQMDQIEAKARSLSTATVHTAAEAFSGFKYLFMAGQSLGEAVQTIGPVLSLATVAGVELGQSADMVTDIMNSMGLAVGKTASVLDMLAATTTGATTTLTQLYEGIKFVGPVAASLNVPINELLTLLGSLADKGLKASLGATGLRRVMSSLYGTNKKSLEIIKSYGLTVEGLDPKVNGLTNSIKKLSDAGLSATDAFSLFGLRGGPTFLALSELFKNSPEAYNELLQRINTSKGMLDNMMFDVSQTIPSRFKILNSAIAESIITIGQFTGATEGLRTGLTHVAGVLNYISGNLDGYAKANRLSKEQISNIKASGDGVKKFAQDSKTFIKGGLLLLGIGALSKGFKGLSLLIRGVRSTMLKTNGVKTFSGVQSSLAKVSKGSTGFFSSLSTGFKKSLVLSSVFAVGLSKTVSNTFKNASASSVGMFARLKTGLGNIAKGVQPLMSRMAKGVSSFFTSLTQGTSGKIIKISQSVGKVGLNVAKMSTWGRIISGVSASVLLLRNNIGKLGKAATSVFSSLGKSKTGKVLLAGFIGYTSTFISNIFQMKESLTGLDLSLKDVIDTIGVGAVRLGQTYWDVIKKGSVYTYNLLTGQKEEATKALGSFNKSLKSNVTNFLSSFSDVQSGKANGPIGYIQNINKSIDDLGNGASKAEVKVQQLHSTISKKHNLEIFSPDIDKMLTRLNDFLSKNDKAAETLSFIQEASKLFSEMNNSSLDIWGGDSEVKNDYIEQLTNSFVSSLPSGIMKTKQATIEYNNTLRILKSLSESSLGKMIFAQGELKGITESLRQEYLYLIDPLAYVNKGLEEEANLLRLSGLERQIYQRTLQQQKDLSEKGIFLSNSENETMSRRIRLHVSEMDALARAKDVAAKYGTEKYKLQLIDEQLIGLKPELIRLLGSEAEAEKALAQAKVGLQGGDELSRYYDDLTNGTARFKQTTIKAFKGVEDSIISMVKTGKLEVGSLFATIGEELLRMSLQQNILAPLLGGMMGEKSGGGTKSGGFFGDIFGMVGGLFNFAHGGSFTVGPDNSQKLTNGSYDDRLVGIRAASGEKVSVSTRSSNDNAPMNIPAPIVNIQVSNQINHSAIINAISGNAGQKAIMTIVKRNRNALDKQEGSM